MTRAASPTYLGGIGLMLEVAHMCPRCGKALSDTPAAATRHLSGNACRPAVFAALPEPEPLVQDGEVPLIPADRQIFDFETPMVRARRPVAFRVLDPVPTLEGEPRALAIPWLRPPDLGEVL
jgi:hypothetical protein